MKLTKSTLAQMIREEIQLLDENEGWGDTATYGPSAGAPETGESTPQFNTPLKQLEKVQQIVTKAFLNKEIGNDPKMVHEYIAQIKETLEGVTTPVPS
jgi:hypothetical protein